jgi:AcrR family transcriptional regulator
MRLRDEHKQEAIISATVKLVNEIGFVSSSVAKIAREAGVSPATIYVYYRNKEDLLVSTYVTIKQKLGEAMLKAFNPNLPIRDIFRTAWQNVFDYITMNPEYFQFTEQFSNSPYAELIDKEQVEKSFEPMMQILQRGIEQKIIKDVNFDILTAFIFYPIYSLSNKRLCANFIRNQENIEKAFNLAWDAIKL